MMIFGFVPISVIKPPSIDEKDSGMRVSANLDLVLRLNNIMDEDVADRADFAGGNYRYLPGRGRELFIELRYRPVDTRQASKG